MPPKKRNYNTRSTKPSDKDQPKLSKIKKRNENEARDQARKHNQSFLQDAHSTVLPYIIEIGDFTFYRQLVHNNDEKYTKLLDKYRKQSKSFSNLRKKYDALKHNFAEMKDVVVYATTEAKKAKADPNANRTFTLDPDVNITVETLEKINLMSKSAGNFAQNLCLYLYGAENLRQKSVTGQPSNRLKGAPATRPGITPTKLQFIYNKARERVALEKGVNNHAQIASLANETIINRAIAKKIANLNKAVKYAALRDQERSSSTSNSGS